MSTSITRLPMAQRVLWKQEDALLEAFRKLAPAERYKLIRRARLRRSWRIGPPRN